MKIRVLKHVPFEGPAGIAVWAREKGHEIEETRLYDDGRLPPADGYDWLVVMGGPMGVHDEREHPWLLPEKRFIEGALRGGKTVVGICLGAQLIADVLGARVFRNEFREIGWFPVSLAPEAGTTPLHSLLPGRFMAFHWHGDTFTIPGGAVRIAGSGACENQAFLYGAGVIGLQFHLESTAESIGDLIRHGSHELTGGPYIQGAEEMLSAKEHMTEIRGILRALLDGLEINFKPGGYHPEKRRRDHDR
jgi:GMP synthase (glutamine-hydrolysing)